MGKQFSGPKMLGEILSQDQNVVDCSSKQLFRFLMGRHESAADSQTLAALNAVRKDVPNLKLLIKEFIKSPAIEYRKSK